MYNVIKRRTELVRSSCFRIYEGTIKKYAVDGIHEIIESSDRHLLKVREVLDIIRDQYYEFMNNMAE